MHKVRLLHRARRVFVAAASVVACSGTADRSKVSAVVADVRLLADGAASRPLSPVSSVGELGTVTVTASGVGATRQEAIRDGAIRAIEQVHGRLLSVSSVRQELGSTAVDLIATRNGSESRASVTAKVVSGGERIEEATSGLISHLTVTKDEEEHGRWRVSIQAEVARYVPSKRKPLSVVVAVTKSSTISRDLADELRIHVTDALATSGLVSVLDRTGSEVVISELNFANSDAAAPLERLKRAQAPIADVAVDLEVRRLDVYETTQPMRTANHEVVLSEGVGELAFRLIVVATRELIGSGVVSATRTRAPTLDVRVDGAAWRRSMLDEMQRQVEAKIADFFAPISASSVPALPRK